MLNPLLISELFWEQSKNWKTIAAVHVENIAQHCSKFVLAAINATVTSDVADRLQAVNIDNALNKRLVEAKSQLADIIDDTKHHPITYDSAFVQLVQEARAK